MTRPHPVDEKIYIFYKWCKSCSICLNLCPAKVFEMGSDGKPVVVNPEQCTMCGLCETHCPDFAIGWTHPPTAENNHKSEENGSTDEPVPDVKQEEKPK